MKSCLSRGSALFLLLWSSLFQTVPGVLAATAVPGSDLAVVDGVRFYPAKGQEKDVKGAVFYGSNVSPTEALVKLGEIDNEPPAGEWTSLPLDNKTPYRYLRYDGPKGSHCHLAELEFYAGKKILKGQPFGSISEGEAPGACLKGFDGNPKSGVHCAGADDQYIGVDIRDLATCGSPTMSPGPGDYKDAQTVKLGSRTAGATIIYTSDGTTPSDGIRHGEIYDGPITLAKSATLQAVATLPEVPVSPVASGVYLIGPPLLTMHTLHIGNSLTASTHNLPTCARTLGYLDDYRAFLHGGATTKVCWEDASGPRKDEWEKDLQSFATVDHFTMQPRDFDLDQETDYAMRFLNVVRGRWPAVQPWLYAEWTEFDRHRPTDKGTEKSPQMSKVFPAQTWEESMGAMLLYVEDLQKKIETKSLEEKAGHAAEFKEPLIIPSAIAMGVMHHRIDRGEVPGMQPNSFHKSLFRDGVHPNAEGEYLVDLTWLCALTGRPVNGAIPVNTKLTGEQAALMQRLAWDVVHNYPFAGTYKTGTRRVSQPQIKKVAQAAAGTVYDITSKTNGAWFRYTLDGSEPTHLHGYVFCGVVTVPPEASLKVVGYKNGLNDSPVVSTE